MSYHERRWYMCSNCGTELDVSSSVSVMPGAPDGWENKGGDTHWCDLCAKAVQHAQRIATQQALVARTSAVAS